MRQAGYVELHTHSAYSFLDGAALPGDLVQRAAALGYPALALTDRDGLYGAMEFSKAAHERGIKPVLGAEVTLEGGAHLLLLAETAQGYAHLCRLISHARMNSPKDAPQLDWATLREYAGGLIALSGCERGEVPALIEAGRHREAEAAARRYRDLFGAKRFFLELHQHYVHGDTGRNAALVELAGHLGLPYVATNNVHYPERAQWRLHGALTAIRCRLTLDTSHRERRANDEFFLKSQQQMAGLFSQYPRAILNTQHIAERCEFDLLRLDYQFPDFDLSGGQSAGSYLEQVCREAVMVKYGAMRPDLEERLRTELHLIRMHRLEGFFLINWKIISHAHANKLSARGRGSSVSSLVCYLLGLSGVDPLQYDLSIGRFLNAELKSIPDIDLDFSRDARAKMMQYVYDNWGPDRAGLVCTFPTYRIRSAIRDLGKALGLPEAQLDKLAKLSEDSSARSLREQMALLPDFRDKVDAPLWRDLVDLAGQIAGLPRHVSQHVGGMIISSRPLLELVPLEPARMEGRVLIQWDKDSVDDARFVKMDFLALGMLSLVDEAVDMIEFRHERPVRWHEVPLNDPAVYEMISQGDTIGVFQVESRAQQQSLPRIQPRNIHDLTVQVAIIRPGPIVGGGMII